MKYYKIIDPAGHHGLVYKEGINVDPLPFNPSGTCEKGGIYFSREDIFAFLSYGTELYEVEPIGEVYEDPQRNLKKWKAHSVKLTYVGKVKYNIKFLVEHGANVHAKDNYPLCWATDNGYFESVKYLVEQGADVHIREEYPLRWAARNGHLEMVKYLAEHGADINTFGGYPLRWAARKGYLNIVKYLVEQGSKIYKGVDSAITLAAVNDHLDIVKYLVEQGVDIQDCDYILQWAAQMGHFGVVEYLKSKM